MFCYKCGIQIPDGSAFCQKCGTRQTKERVEAIDDRYTSEPPSSQHYGVGSNILIDVSHRLNMVVQKTSDLQTAEDYFWTLRSKIPFTMKSLKPLTPIVKLNNEQLRFFGDDIEIGEFLAEFFRGYQCFSNWELVNAKVKPYPEAPKMKLQGIGFKFSSGMMASITYGKIIFLREGLIQGVYIITDPVLASKDYYIIDKLVPIIIEALNCFYETKVGVGQRAFNIEEYREWSWIK